MREGSSAAPIAKRDHKPNSNKARNAGLVRHGRSGSEPDPVTVPTEEIEVFYLPSYSPELNPDECLNADLKDGVTRRAPARSKAQLKDAAISHLRKLQKSPQRVRNYFKHKPVRYAA